MPLRLKLALGTLVVAAVALSCALTALASRASPWLAVIVAASCGALAAYLAFVYEPRFDPTGSTLWRRRTRERVAALTFDDGPSPHTREILSVLAQHGVRATFFFLGENATRHPDLVARARAEGHAIGNHGHSHRKLHRLGPREIDGELQSAARVLGPLSELRGRALARVPHGFKSLTVLSRLRALGYQLVAWTAGVWDSDRPGAGAIVARLERALAPGAVLLLHDGDGLRPDPDRAQTVAALAAFLPAAAAAGYRFVTIPELFA